MLSILKCSLSLAFVGFLAFTLETVNLYPALSGSNTLWVDDDNPTCDGFSPCYRTIQEAVAQAQEGDTIRVRPGIYYGPIVIAKSLTLQGESREKVIIYNSEPDQEIISILGPSITVVENMSILGLSPSEEVPATAGVAISGQQPRVTLNNIKLVFHVVAISLTADELYSPSPSSGQLLVHNSDISRAWTGIFIRTDGSYTQIVRDSKLFDNITSLDVAGQGAIRIDRNQITGNDVGVQIKGSVEAVLENNMIQDNGNGVKSYEKAKIKLTSNKITDNLSNGVTVQDTAQALLTNNHITNNGLSSRSLSIFPLIYDPFFGVGGGMFFNAEGFGVVLGLAASGELIENYIEGNLFGVGATQALDRASNQLFTPRITAQRNQIKENGWGVWLRGAEATLKDNEIVQNDVIALSIDPQLVARLEFPFPASGVLVESGQPLVQSNNITRNGLGIVLQGQSSPTLLRNQILNNSEYGIALYQKSCFAQVVTELAFQGKVLGEANELSGNGQGDLCPPDYPWPPGFRK